MVSDFGDTTVAINDSRTGYAGDLLAEVDVVIAVDVCTHEEKVVQGDTDGNSHPQQDMRRPS